MIRIQYIFFIMCKNYIRLNSSNCFNYTVFQLLIDFNRIIYQNPIIQYSSHLRFQQHLRFLFSELL